MEPFDEFIGIDFSGAKGPSVPGLRVAVARAGECGVSLVGNARTRSGVWRRSDLLAWLCERAALASRDGLRVLVGMDLAFGFPFVDRGSYFPGLLESPRCVRGLWGLVDVVSGGDAVGECYAGRVYLDDASVLRRYFLHGRYRGDRYEGRTRVMETGSRVVKGANPTTVFNLVGPATVGVSSLSGMRLVLALERALGDAVGFWPFDDGVDGRAMVVTEVFPRLYYLRAGGGGRDWMEPGAFARVLGWYGAETGERPGREDEGDALVVASALRALAVDEAVWRGPMSAAEAAAREGWIFGVV